MEIPAKEQEGMMQASSGGGVSSEHDSSEPFEFLVGPTTSDQFNTARLRLIPVACWRVDDIRFAFDSSFVAADSSREPAYIPGDIRAELQHLVTLLKDHPGCPLSVFGHADPVGNDDYNKLLSGRRAMAIYALLIFNTDPGAAVKMWQFISGRENWGSNQRDNMRALTGLPVTTQDTELMKSYMQKLCPSDLKLTKTDFLAQGADAGGKGDFQGCGEFNPVLLFSKEEQASFDMAGRGDQNKPENQAAIATRNVDNARNRRVMVLLFRKGSRVEPTKWPCPSATEGTAGCRKRFWSNGEARRSIHLQGVERDFTKSGDTFACRFYQRISDRSPCEGLKTVEFGLLHMQIFDGAGRIPLANRKYKIHIADRLKPRFKGVLNDKGILRHEFVFHDNYVLSVEGCDEKSPMIVLAMSNPTPTVRYLETSALTFFVKTEDGVPIDGANVSVSGLGQLATDSDGIADFGLVSPKQYKFGVSKDEFLAHHADKLGPDIVSLTEPDGATGLGDGAHEVYGAGSGKALRDGCRV